MRNLADHFRPGPAELSLDEALQQPVAALLGVSSRAADALGRIGVASVFDLGSSWLFANAAAAIEAPSGGLGTSSADLLDPGVLPQPREDVTALPLTSLRGLSDDEAEALAAGLEVTTLRELALWPPRRIACRLVREASGGTTGDLEEDQAETLRPRLGEYPTERVYYDTLVMLGLGESADRRPLAGAISLQPVVDEPVGFGQPAVGALATFSQSWYAKGITLGHMLHSLALAPGEATRIAVVDWSRRTRVSAAESIEEAERLDTAATHSRAISEVQNAVADEMQSGGSMSSGWARSESKGKAGGFSVGGGVAGAYQGVTGVLGFGGGTSSSRQEAETRTEAHSTSWSIGNRSLMAEMTQRVNDRTEQHSASVRNRRASAVREVAQAEHEQVSTRVVANYNHMHALTVQYYEVVQIYRVVAQVHSVQRVLFLPFELLDFAGDDAADVVARFRAPLLAVALGQRVRDLLLDDRGTVEVRSAVRVRLPVLAFDLPASSMVMAARRVADDAGTGAGGGTGGTTQPPPAGGDRPGGILTAPPPSKPRLVVRPGSVVDSLPGDAELTAVSFDDVRIDRVRLDRPGVPATHSTYAVPEALDQVDLPAAVPLRTVAAIHVARGAGSATTGTMTLHFDGGGVERTLPITLDLGDGTSMQKVAFLAADPRDRRGELMAHLQANRAYYTRAVLENLDSAALVMLLSAYTWRGKPLVDQVEPNPLAVAGNFLVLRAPLDDDEPAGLGDDGTTWGELVAARGLTSEQHDARLVPIPTGGVFAEAVLGRSNSAEKLDITRFWNWQDSPIPLQPPEIAPVALGSRATAEDLRPGQLGAPVLTIQNPTVLPDPAGLTAALTTLASANLFRDMSGLAGTQAAAQAAGAGTLQAATAVGAQAGANLKTVTDQAVAMGQAAADMWKTLQGGKGGGGGGGGGAGGGAKNVSAEGARINQGRDMDRRGVSGAGGGSASESAGNRPRVTELRSEFQAAGGGAEAGAAGNGSPAVSRELAFADLGAAGVSSPLLRGVVSALAGSPAVLGAAPGAVAGSQAAQLIATLEGDLVSVGKTLPGGSDLKGVSIKPIDQHRHGKEFLAVGYRAWTNSAREIYFDLAAFEKDRSDFEAAGFSTDEASLLARVWTAPLLRHEAHHVEQFRKSGAPKLFADMVRYEDEAYRESLDWIAKAGTADLLKRIFALAKLKPNDDLSDLLTTYKASFHSSCVFFAALRKKIGKVGDDRLRDAMQDHKDAEGKSEPYLPKTLQGKGKAYKVTDLY